ncbi:MAG: hypothetical protein U0935_06445 [Pirellulales bacterium]
MSKKLLDGQSRAGRKSTQSISLPHQLMYNSDTTIRRAGVTRCHREAHVRSLQYGAFAEQFIPGLARVLVEPPLGALLAVASFLPKPRLGRAPLAGTGRVSYPGFHSKVLHEPASREVGPSQKSRFARGNFAFVMR